MCRIDGCASTVDFSPPKAYGTREPELSGGRNTLDLDLTTELKKHHAPESR